MSDPAAAPVSAQMLAFLRSVPVLFYLAFALTASTAMATSKTISHSYILSLNADVAANARDSIVEALKKNGAKITNIIEYPGIMQAISFEDTQAQGQVDMQSDEVRINAWKSSLTTYDEHIHALEQDQQVNIN